MFYVIVGENLVDDQDPTWTVDVYAEVEPGARLDAVAGDVNNPKMVSTTGSFYQNPFGGPTSQSINPALFDTFPDLEYDSFVTIELLTQEDNALSNIGIDWTDFENGGAVNSTDGSWFITPDDPQGLAGNGHDEDCDGVSDEYGVRIARLTVRGNDSIVWVEALFQGKDADGQTWLSSDLLAIANEGGACVPDDTTCYADINGDWTIDVLDLLQVISDWGPCGNSCPADIDGNGAVDVLDLLEVIANWGPCPGYCESGWYCGGGDIEDFGCSGNCYCFALDGEGSTACAELVSGNCGSYTLCVDGDCPEGYICIESSCCSEPICMPLCD
jgi:hypothetical protein